MRNAWSNLRLRGKGATVVAIPLLVLVFSSGIFLLTTRADDHADQWVRHTQEARRQISVIDGLITARESAQRGYVLSGDAGDLAASGHADASIGEALAALATTVRDNPAQLTRLAAEEAALAKEPGAPVGTARTTSGQVQAWLAAERQATAVARQGLTEMDAAERSLLGTRQEDVERGRVLAVAGVIGLLAIGVLGGFLGVRLFASGVARRVDRLERELGHLDVGELVDPPDESADELGVLSRRLRTTVRMLAAREAELGEARAFLENIVMVGPVVVLRGVAGGDPTYVSPNCERVLGVGCDTALAADFWKRSLSSEDLARFAEVTEQLFEAQGPSVVGFEAAFDLDGTARYLSCLITREAFADERGILIYLLDITDRHDAETEMANAQRELSAIATASPDIIAVYGADLRIRYVSEAVTAITGIRGNDRIGQQLGKTVHEEDRQQLVDAVRGVISGATEDFTVRVKARHATGRYVMLEAHGRPLLGSSGAPVAAVAIFRDISDRIALEAELVEARDTANAASGAKSEFLSRMSHELRTPLNVVLGFAQLLQMEPLPVEQHGWVDQVLRAGRHLLDLINEVLDIARIESGALALSPEPVSLRDVVGEAVEQLRPVAAANDVVLDYLIEGDDLHVQADRQRLMQVLFNLLANAAKYNRPHGTVLVTCRAREQNAVEIRVSDTGIGIAPEHLERLFVPFDRLGAENSVIEGTGVGLPLSLRLVEAMDGEILVESTPGDGSTFVVVLPRAQSPCELAGVAAELQVDVRSADGSGPHGTLLYIEDNLTNLNLMQRLVQRRPGVALTHAFDGRTGLALARRGGADLILLDLHLPDMTGIEVLGQLRADPATARIPVYIVSADATAGQVVRMSSAGAAGYLTKPLDVRRVLALLDDVMDGRVPVNEAEA